LDNRGLATIGAPNIGEQFYTFKTTILFIFDYLTYLA